MRLVLRATQTLSELVALFVMIAAVVVAIHSPEHRDALTAVAAVAILTSYIGLVARVKLGVLSYFLLIVAVMPAVSYWGFMCFGDHNVMANTDSLIRATYLEVSVSFVAIYVSGFVLSLYGRVHGDKLDAAVIRDGLAIGARQHRMLTGALSLVSITAAYIYQPSPPGLAYGEIQYNLVAGSAWNYVCLIAYALVMPAKKKGLLAWVALIGVPVWLILHFDRADILGLLLLWILVVNAQNKGEKAAFQVGRIVLLAMLAAIVVLLFAYIGVVRSRGLVWDESLLMVSAKGLLNYSTVQAANHAFMSAIEFVSRVGHVNLFADYPIRIFPSFLVSHPASAEAVVQQAVGTWFGMHLAGEFYLNAGLTGALLAAPVTLTVIAMTGWALRRLFGQLGSWLWYVVAMLLVVRIGWYGLFYYVKAIVLLVPAFAVVYISATFLLDSLLEQARREDGVRCQGLRKRLR